MNGYQERNIRAEHYTIRVQETNWRNCPDTFKCTCIGKSCEILIFNVCAWKASKKHSKKSKLIQNLNILKMFFCFFIPKMVIMSKVLPCSASRFRTLCASCFHSSHSALRIYHEIKIYTYKYTERSDLLHLSGLVQSDSHTHIFI